MAIADFDTYRSMLENASQVMSISKNSLSVIGGRTSSLWVTAPLGGTAPTTAVAPTRSTTGAIGQNNGGSGALRLMRVCGYSQLAGSWILVDRLSHQGGLSGTVTTAQTTNLPTAALTRYTSGAGVMACFEIYTQIGTTATTITASYTNQAGTAGQTSLAVPFGATSDREAGRCILMSLQAGDSGVRSVESVTVLATTGTAGAFGVTLFKPLLSFQCQLSTDPVIEFDALLSGGCQMPEIVDDACLSWMFFANTTTTGVFQPTLFFREE